MQEATSMHPWSRHWYLQDHVLFRKRDQWDMLVTKATPGIDGWTDHRLAISKMQINLQPHKRPRGKRPPIQSTTLAVLGHARRQHQDWFDDDAAISNLLDEKNLLHEAYVTRPTDDNKAAFCRSRRLAQQRLREMQDAWTVRMAEEIQGYAGHNKWKNFFTAIKAVYGPTTKANAPLLRADCSTLLTEKTQILQRWTEHFRSVLNRLYTNSDAAIARLSQVETNADLDLPPSHYEAIGVVPQLSSGKTSGSDAIPAEIHKHDGLQLMDYLTVLF
nr:unnamed protein product [Spirometra erinaceieuropaei]